MNVVPPHRTTRSFTQRLPAPPERVFPLLCPVRETEWVPGWNPRLVVTGSGVAEEDCVFLTGPPEREAVWVVTTYEPPSRIGFVKVTPGETAVRIGIELTPAGDGETAAGITYRYTALGEAGVREVDGFTQASWERFMRAWGRTSPTSSGRGASGPGAARPGDGEPGAGLEGGEARPSTTNPEAGAPAPMISGHEALERLREGNRRFASDTPHPTAVTAPSRRDELVEGQSPFAVVLGCSDSRVPAELVFDQGLGDLFVIRVAGNVVAPSQVGSVEFAAEAFGTRLVVVMGHSSCGAVTATLDELRRPSEGRSPNLRAIVDRIRPAVEALMETELRDDRDALVGAAVRANVRAAADHLRHGSELLETLIRSDGLLVVGAEYSLETGVVDFFDGTPAPPAAARTP